MINIPNINLNKQKTQIILFGTIILLFLMNYLSIQVILSILVLFFVVIHYSDFNKELDNHLFKKNKGYKLDYNDNIGLLLKRLTKYKKYNRMSFIEGKEYWKKYVKYIQKLENDNVINYNHYFDKAHYYFNESIKSFNHLMVSFKDKKIMEIEYSNDTHNLDDIKSIIQGLNKEGYLILYEISKRLNTVWKEDPHVVNKEIVLDYPEPILSSMFNNSKLYDL